MRLIRITLTLLMAAAGVSALAAPPAGRYRLVGVQDAASELILHPDGRFEYALAYGALDERAEGRWTSDGKTVHLTTVPKPKPAVFSAGAVERDPAAPFTIKVTWPDGRGIAGVDFILSFDAGEPIRSYTQEYGWNLDPADKRTPRSISFALPMHGLRSQPFAIDAGKANQFTFVLTPNDLGVVDFGDVEVTIEPGRVVMHRNGGRLTYAVQGR